MGRSVTPSRLAMATIKRILAVSLGAVGAGVLYCSNDNSRVLQAAQKFRTESVHSSKLHDEPFQTTKWDYNWDRREPSFLVRPSKGGEDDIRYSKEIAEKKPKASRNIILIRHGQYHQANRFYDAERTLTEKGIEQAQATGDRLLALNLPYSRMVRSTMTRAQQTGDHILSRLNMSSLPVENDSMLEEGAPFPPEPPRKSWEPHEYCFFQDGSRIEAAFRNYFYRADQHQEKDSYDIVVCHANVIRYFVCRALQLPPEAWLRINLHHASISWVRIRPNGRVGLLTMGNCGHLRPELLTLE